MRTKQQLHLQKGTFLILANFSLWMPAYILLKHIQAFSGMIHSPQNQATRMRKQESSVEHTEVLVGH